MAQRDVEQREVRRPFVDHRQRFGHMGRRANPLNSEIKDRGLEIDGDDGVVFDNQHVVRHAKATFMEHKGAAAAASGMPGLADWAARRKCRGAQIRFHVEPNTLFVLLSVHM